MPLSEIPDNLPKAGSGRKVSRMTVYRWTNVGLCGGITLETLWVGGAMFTSRQALARFFERVGVAKRGRRQGPPGIDPKAAGRADAELAAAGL